MKKIYYLSTCSTCIRILNELDGLLSEFELQDIKNEKITPNQIEEMHALSGSYESLFSRRAMKYKSLGLGAKNLSEDDYKNYILEEYTFLKRPIFVIGDKIFVGNSAKTVEAIKSELTNN
ncbi:ArsC/Spx/MgsR family protein [Reichenbachiella sp. MALMAid0571]|uniref:arsenate reductase family protein n=1 Tax=Reichenbachiella sp. MALMAid0571 TaxID=3143939 RepID=UPI0032DFCF4C